MSRTFTIRDLGRTTYADAHALQKELLARRIAGEIGDTILFVEHPRVITLGRSTKPDHILATAAQLDAHGITVHEVGRGGDVTYHGPGQVVMYPIIDLKPDRKDVRKYVWSLEEAMIRTCADFDLLAGRNEGLNGAWIDERKVGAVGVRISRWVTMHGLALNVNTNLEHFRFIIPCGIEGKAVTSLQAELGREIDLVATRKALATHFADLYAAALQSDSR